MKRIILATLAAGLVAVGVPSANAAPGDEYLGGCGFNSTSDPTEQVGGQDVQTGEINARLVTYNLASGPVAAAAACEIRVNGVTQDRLDASDVATMTGSGIEFGAKVTQYPADADIDFVELCTIVDFGGGDVRESCGAATTITVPPDEVNQLIEQFVDPLLCSLVLAPLGNTLPDVPGVLEIEADGDVHILGAPYWDCPPYDEF